MSQLRSWLRRQRWAASREAHRKRVRGELNRLSILLGAANVLGPQVGVLGVLVADNRPYVLPLTGREFLAWADRNLAPRTDEEMDEIFADLEDEGHRCVGCDPERLRKFGRDVWCPGYLAQCIQDQLTEDSPNGRAIRDMLAKEAAEERARKAGPQ